MAESGKGHGLCQLACSLGGLDATGRQTLSDWLAANISLAVVEMELPGETAETVDRSFVIYGSQTELQGLLDKLQIDLASLLIPCQLDPVADGWDQAYQDRPGFGWQDRFWIGSQAPSPEFERWIRLPHLLRSFGGGDHAATQAILELLAQQDPPGPSQSVLDLGCGCGMLLMLCAAYGFQRVVGTEIDAQALADAEACFALNHSWLPTIQIHNTPDPRSLGESFAVVICNIQLAGQRHLAELATAVTRDNGCIFLSGFTANDREAVQAAYAEFGWRTVAELDVRGWCGLQLRNS